MTFVRKIAVFVTVHNTQGMEQLQMPMCIFVYFQETPLTIKGSDLLFNRGDIVIFLGDGIHAGGAWNNELANYRLFRYLPTKQCTQSWSPKIFWASCEKWSKPREVMKN